MTELIGLDALTEAANIGMIVAAGTLDDTVPHGRPTKVCRFLAENEVVGRTERRNMMGSRKGKALDVFHPD